MGEKTKLKNPFMAKTAKKIIAFFKATSYTDLIEDHSENR